MAKPERGRQTFANNRALGAPSPAKRQPDVVITTATPRKDHPPAVSKPVPKKARSISDALEAELLAALDDEGFEIKIGGTD